MITKYRAARLSHCVPFFFFSFLFRDTVIDSPVLRSENEHAPSLESKKQYAAALAIYFFFFLFLFPLPLPVILVALSMDFNVDCNKLRPRERGSDGLKARELESPLFLPPSSSAFLNASQCSLLTMTNLPVLREN